MPSAKSLSTVRSMVASPEPAPVDAGDVRGVSGRERGNGSERPMLAEGRTTRLRSLTRGALLGLVVFLTLASSLPIGRADRPVEHTYANATRSVLWTMDTPENLTNTSVSFVGGNAILPWLNQSLSWTQASQILANGTAAAGMTGNASGLGMRANWTNYVQNPTFSSNASWNYLNGTTRNVTAVWNQSGAVGELASSWSGDQHLWESMDNVAAHWLAMPNSLVVQNKSNPPPKQGTGTMGIEAAAAATSVGAVNSSLTPVNWSAYNRMVLWIYLNVSVVATFNVTARAGTSIPVVTTTAVPLAPRRGWQEVSADLDQLGNASVRSSLYQLGLRFNAPGVFPLGTWFNVDDVRLGTAKIFNETATIAQTLRKSYTTSLLGSARLSFDWSVINSPNVSVDSPEVSIAPPGSPRFLPLIGPGGTWNVFSNDLSASTSAAGAYNLTFALLVAANTTGPYDVELLIDNVTLVFPDVTNGTFVSNVLSMSTMPQYASQYLSLGWTGPVVPRTSVTLGIRTGNNTVPGSASWSGWQWVDAPGPRPLFVPGALNFEVRILLNTTNASASPVVQTVTLATQHRAASGTVTADVFTADSDFIRWRSFSANFTSSSGTSLQFSIASGGPWLSVEPGASLLTYDGGRRIQWRAAFQGSDGLHTPVLTNVTLVYDFLGPPALAVMTLSGSALQPGSTVNVTSGQTLQFGLVVYDSGSHVIPSTTYGQVWGLSNGTGGSVTQNGTLTTGKPGLYELQVTINEFGTTASLHASIWVRIMSATAAFSIWDAWPFMAVGIAALLGFATYELVVRRLFSIDDVFLIGKDGRLMSHNTRRMLADRDEDILSGMLTAINSFVRDSWREENSHIRRFVIGGKTTVVERGEHVFLAAVYSGRVPGWASRDIRALVDDLETYFGKEFATWSGSPEDLQSLREVMRRFASRMRYSRRRVWKGIAG